MTPTMTIWSPKVQGPGKVRRPPQDRRPEERELVLKGQVRRPPRTCTKHPNLHRILKRNSKSLKTKVPSSRPSTRSLPWRTTTTSAWNVVKVAIPTMNVPNRVVILWNQHWSTWGRNYRATMWKKIKLPKEMMMRSNGSASRTTKRPGLESTCTFKQSHYQSLEIVPMEKRASMESEPKRRALCQKMSWTKLSTQQVKGASLRHAKKWNRLFHTPTTGCTRSSTLARTSGSSRFFRSTVASFTPRDLLDLE